MKVLIVDDQLLILMELEHFVKELGHEVVTATSGNQAFGILHQNHHQGDYFGAVITDMQMPGGSGLELLQSIERLKHRPPCLVHSSAETFGNNDSLLNLSQLEVIFSGTSFHLKPLSLRGDNLAYIKQFLDEASALQSS